LPSVNTVRVRLSNKPVLGANSQKKNKNHLKPISGQGSALNLQLLHACTILNRALSVHFNSSLST
jgi:hypothetical protein